MPLVFSSKDLIDACAAGMYLLLGAVHGHLWKHRRDRPSHLWLACAAFGALVVDLTGIVLRASGKATPTWVDAMNTSGVAIATASLFQLVVSLGDRPAGRASRLLQTTVLVLGPLPALVWPSQLHSILMVACLTLLAASAIRAFRSGQVGDPEASVVAWGLFFLLACLGVDLLMELEAIPKVYGFPILGFLVLFLTSAMALNTRYEREHQELAALRFDLEDRVRDRTRELEEASRRLTEATRTDQLTGLPNRRGFQEEAEMEMARIHFAWRPCTLVLVNVDHFRRINETFGQATGDAVLRDLANTLRCGLRGQDLVARWGGEEFIALLPETEADDAARAVELVRRAIMAEDLGQEGEKLPVTASFGLAEHRPGIKLEATLAEADRALRRAKAEGRNRVVVGHVGSLGAGSTAIPE